MKWSFGATSVLWGGFFIHYVAVGSNGEVRKKDGAMSKNVTFLKIKCLILHALSSRLTTKPYSDREEELADELDNVSSSDT